MKKPYHFGLLCSVLLTLLTHSPQLKAEPTPLARLKVEDYGPPMPGEPRSRDVFFLAQGWVLEEDDFIYFPAGKISDFKAICVQTLKSSDATQLSSLLQKIKDPVVGKDPDIGRVEDGGANLFYLSGPKGWSLFAQSRIMGNGYLLPKGQEKQGQAAVDWFNYWLQGHPHCPYQPPQSK